MSICTTVLRLGNILRYDNDNTWHTRKSILEKGRGFYGFQEVESRKGCTTSWESWLGSVSSSVSGAGPSVKHYFRIIFPRKTYNRLIAKNLRNSGETCRWWPSIPKDHNPTPENSQRQGWTKIDKIDVNWKIESIPVWLTLYYFNLTFIFVKISQIKLFSYAFGVLIRKFSIF